MKLISIREYAAIAGHIYKSSQSNYMGTTFTQLTNEKLNKRKQKDGWNILPDVDPFVNPKHPFFAALYIYFREGKAETAVIAMRGTMTTMTDNVITDVVSWWSGAMGDGKHDVWPKYVPEALVFTNHVFEYLAKHFPELHKANIRFTGHSLGGALAQIVGARCCWIPTVVFNSPSCRGMLGSQVDTFWPLIHSVNSHYGVLNKVGGLPIGKLNTVNVPEMAEEAKSLFAHFDQAEFTRGEAMVADSDMLNDASIIDSALDRLGQAEHIDAMLRATSKLDQLPKEHMEVIQCEAPDDHHRMVPPIYKLVVEKGCEVEVTLKAVAETIIEQHSIVNVIKTLPHNHKVAGQVV